MNPPPKPATSPVPQSDVSAIQVSSRIPEFWTDQPRVWYIRAEAVLLPQKMGDEAQFQVVVSKLGKEAIQQVTDILIKPPDIKKYDTLKNRLLAIYEESETRQIQKLIGEMELGDQKPSQLLRRMRDLARGKIPDHTLRILWQNHLPPSVRAVLAVTEAADMDNLATVADKIMETMSLPQVAEINSVSQVQGNCNENNKILAEIAKLSLRIANIEKMPFRGHSRSRSTRRMRSRSKTTSWVDELSTVLYGLRAAVRTDNNVSAAEMTYAQTIRLPSDFYDTQKVVSCDDYSLVQKLRSILNSLKPNSKSHSSKSFFIHPDLRECEFVFVRNDVHKPLKPTYDGPYRVLKRGTKVYEIQFPNRIVNISIDRLKPAYTIQESASETVNIAKSSDSESRTVTRYGRVTRRPVRFAT
ncbi:hypothetical protein ACJJTC_017818 [Scirpophaga incertulas]